MQVFAIVVSLAITLVAVALFAKAIGQILATLRIGQPAVGRSGRQGPTLADDAHRDPGSHPDAPVDATWGCCTGSSSSGSASCS